MGEQLLCSKHRQPLAFVCAVQNCGNRRMCEECKTNENLHFTQHANFIYRIKDFYDYSASQELIPRLQKGIQDSQNFINTHKSFYRQQSRTLTADFELINEQFREVTEGYKNIYMEAFDKEMNMFDEQMMSIKKLLNEYNYQKSQQESFFSRLFSNDDKSHKQPLDDLVKKHSKVFKVRASIITLRSKISTAKANRTAYKSSEQDQAKFDQLKDYFRSFVVGFYDKFKQLLANEGSSTVLKNDILSQSRVLSGSRVSMKHSMSASQVSIDSSNSLKTSRAASITSKPPEKVKALPDPHQNVVKLLKRMNPIQYPAALQVLPGFHNRDEGPFRYGLGTYQGTYEDGVRSGRGVFVFSKDGSYYQGTWQDDSMWGYGRLITPSSYYEGQIANGMAHGLGTYENGVMVYSGEWRCDKRHGKGEENFKQGRHHYKGEFADDRYSGQGTLQGPDFMYTGSFREGMFEGEGIIKYRNGEIFKGIFKAGERAVGRHSMPDASYYDGEYENGVPHGKGQFRWSDGLKYVGSWRGGVQEGEGVEVMEGGREMRGVWKNGTWFKWV